MRGNYTSSSPLHLHAVVLIEEGTKTSQFIDFGALSHPHNTITSVRPPVRMTELDSLSSGLIFGIFTHICGPVLSLVKVKVTQSLTLRYVYVPHQQGFGLACGV